MDNMHEYVLEVSFRYVPGNGTVSMEQFLDCAVKHLDELGAKGLSVVADSESGEFDLSLTLAAEPWHTEVNVIVDGMALIRTAFHTCYARTPDWPSPDDVLAFLKAAVEKAVLPA